MEPKSTLESIFVTIKNDVKTLMLFREGVEGLGRSGDGRGRSAMLTGVLKAPRQNQYFASIFDRGAQN